MNRDDLDRLLRILADLDGSDMHIKAGAPPRVRVDGLLRTLDDEPEFTDEDTLALAQEIMPPKILADPSRRSARPTSPTASRASGGSAPTPSTSARRWPWPCDGSSTNARDLRRPPACPMSCAA